MTKATLAIYLPDLSGGGAERLHVGLVEHFMQRGFAPRFLLDRQSGALLDQVPNGCPIDALNAPRQMAALPRLVRYLRKNPPDILVANMEHMAVMAVAARAIARAPTRIVVTQHNTYSEQLNRSSWQWKALPPLFRITLPRADAIVAVSAGVADDLSAKTGIPRENIVVIHNGVIGDDFVERSSGEPDHPWFTDGGGPVLMAMGRMVPQKDFVTLLRAFANIAPVTDARLIILGEGPLRHELEMLVAALGLNERVAMPGFVPNPLPWLRHARLFILSSRFEGFGNVIAEALACGTPVVSTDCPHGPSEILDGGRFGQLVPIENQEALGQAMAASLRLDTDRKKLVARGAEFNLAHCADQYEALFDTLRQAGKCVA